MAWHFLGEAETLLKEGQVKALQIDETAIALYRLEGRYYATHNICTHQTALLSEGFVEDGTIECPLHQGKFDIRSGKALCMPVTKDIKTFLIKTDEKGVSIDVTQPADYESDSQEQAAPEDKATDKEQVFVVVGAGQAAASAIGVWRKNGFGGKIHLIGAEWYPPYERPPLSKDILLNRLSPDGSELLSRETLAKMDVDFHAGASAHHIDSKEKCVTFGDNQKIAQKIAYDKLLIATGSTPRRLESGDEIRPYLYYLGNRDDAVALKRMMRKGLRMGIIGGGFIGLEAASALCESGGKPIIIERAPRILSRVIHPSIAVKIHQRAEQAGAVIMTNQQCDSITLGENGVIISFADGKKEEVDIILVGIGSQANLQIIEDTEIACKNGGIIVDRHGATSVPDIYAAGDVAIFPEHEMRLESWQNANEQSAIAARHMMGEKNARYEIHPWFWSDQFGMNIQIVGLSSPDDDAITQAYDSGSITYLHDGKNLKAAIALDAPQALRDARLWLSENISAAELKKRLAQKPQTKKMPHRFGGKQKSKFIGDLKMQLADYYVWPKEGMSRIPDWVYTDETIYGLEVEKIFHGASWNYVALEAEIPNKGDFKKSFVGPTPVVVTRAQDGKIYVFENRCAHRASEFCHHHSGNAEEFVCPYHQWSYDLEGNLVGVPFRRGVDGKGGMPKDFDPKHHSLKKLNTTTRGGVIFASFKQDMESLEDYLSPEILAEFDATFDGRKPVLLGYYRNTLPGNWKLYHENLKDPYHATLLHTFLVSFGLLVAGNKSQMLCDKTGRHGVMASAKQEGAKVKEESRKEMRAYVEGMQLKEPRFMDYKEEFDSPWSVTMQTIWPNMIVQREMNTLGVRQIVPQGPNEFIMNWTMFGFEGDTPEMTEHRLIQGNLMGPAGFLGFEDNEAMKFVQDGMLRSSGGTHLVALDPDTGAGTSDTLISESAIRAMYQHWRSVLEL